MSNQHSGRLRKQAHHPTMKKAHVLRPVGCQSPRGIRMFCASPTPYRPPIPGPGHPGVRTHPFFWVLSFAWASRINGQQHPARPALPGLRFISILVHEYGHGLTAGTGRRPSDIFLLCLRRTVHLRGRPPETGRAPWPS